MCIDLFIVLQHGTEKKGVSHDTIEAPRGWHFSTKSKWEVDMNRVVDGEGTWVHFYKKTIPSILW